MTDHPVRVDDDIEPLLIDVAGFERRLLQRQALSLALCAIAETLS
jgi:hypothetical protein